MTFPSKVISPLATLGPLALLKVTKGPKGKFDKLLMFIKWSIVLKG